MMKKLLTISILLLVGCTAYAEGNIAKQTTDVDMSGVALVVNKQPKNTEVEQNVKIRRSGLIFIVNVNGKLNIQKEKAN